MTTGIEGVEERPAGRVSSRFAIPLLLAVVFSGCGVDTDFKTVHSIEVGNSSIIIEAAHSAVAYGPSSIRVRRVDAREDVIVYEGAISNDGGEITVDNIRPDFRSENDLRLCLNGVEQEDEYVRMDVMSRNVASNVRNCTS